MPIGLLTDIAADFHITEARAGLLISVYAWVVAFLSLPLMLLVCKMEYRRLLLGTILLFIVSHVLSAFATGYTMLMVSRIGVACSHAVFWSIASPIAVRIVPEPHRALALSMIVTGTSIAMIVGLPLGRVVGLYVGWRMTFLYIGILAAAITAYMAFVFPKVPNRDTFSVGKLPLLLKNKVLMAIYLLTLVMVVGHYTGYSYIEPFLEQAAYLPDDLITLTLTLFGVSGIVGSILFTRYYTRFPYTFIGLSVTGISLFLLVLHVASFHPFTIMLVCILWGVAITAYNVVFQAEIIKYAPQESTAVAMSVYSGIYNLGIGCGALSGGVVCTYFSISYVGYAGGLLAAVAAIYCLKHLFKLLKTAC